MTTVPTTTAQPSGIKTRLIVTVSEATNIDVEQFALELDAELAEHGTVTRVFAATGQLLVVVDDHGWDLLAEHSLVESIAEDKADPPSG